MKKGPLWLDGLDINSSSPSYFSLEPLNVEEGRHGSTPNGKREGL